MTSLRETIQESFTLVRKVMAMKKKVSHCLNGCHCRMDQEYWEIAFEFMLLKMTERHQENG